MPLTKDPTNIRWKKVQAPKPWRPQEPARLMGEFVQVREHVGRDGSPYSVVYIRAHEGVYFTSGTVLTNLVNAAGLKEGDYVRIEFTGWAGSGEYPYRDFDLYVEAVRE